jgi:hypothetical protein
MDECFGIGTPCICFPTLQFSIVPAGELGRYRKIGQDFSCPSKFVPILQHLNIISFSRSRNLSKGRSMSVATSVVCFPLCVAVINGEGRCVEYRQGRLLILLIVPQMEPLISRIGVSSRFCTASHFIANRQRRWCRSHGDHCAYRTGRSAECQPCLARNCAFWNSDLTLRDVNMPAVS